MQLSDAVGHGNSLRLQAASRVGWVAAQGMHCHHQITWHFWPGLSVVLDDDLLTLELSLVASGYRCKRCEVSESCRWYETQIRLKLDTRGLSVTCGQDQGPTMPRLSSQTSISVTNSIEDDLGYRVPRSRAVMISVADNGSYESCQQ